MNRKKVPNTFQALAILTCGWFLKYRWQENSSMSLELTEEMFRNPALIWQPYSTWLHLGLTRETGRLRGTVRYRNREWKSDLPSRSPLSAEGSLQATRGASGFWLRASFLLSQAAWPRTLDRAPWHVRAGERQVRLPSEENRGPWILQQPDLWLWHCLAAAQCCLAWGPEAAHSANMHPSCRPESAQWGEVLGDRLGAQARSRCVSVSALPSPPGHSSSCWCGALGFVETVFVYDLIWAF